ncbi:MAG: hypothetical protein LBS09_08185 [Bacteroidales bacterium]|jgi:outer membrane biosynthesis protein TonB|nr:hypothetical protein [Bacteroidales bacterium]
MIWMRELMRKTMGYIRQGCKHVLIGLEEHAVGILATIAVHLLIIAAVLVLKISATAKHETYIMMELSQTETPAEEMDTPQGENVHDWAQDMQQTYNIRNIPVNVAENHAVENIEQMVRDIKTEMNIQDPQEDMTEEEEGGDELDSGNSNGDKPPTDNRHTVYRGPTTVSYDLGGRTPFSSVSVYVPVYKCQEEGKVVVDIVVNPKGYVLTAEINPAASSQDPCLTEAAKNAAGRSRFNDSPSAPPKQRGSITYIFVAQ